MYDKYTRILVANQDSRTIDFTACQMGFSLSPSLARQTDTSPTWMPTTLSVCSFSTGSAGFSLLSPALPVNRSGVSPESLRDILKSKREEVITWHAKRKERAKAASNPNAPVVRLGERNES